MERRILLRNSKYLRSNTESLVGSYGDGLNSDLLGKTQKIKNGRGEYFRVALHTPLENIRYDHLNSSLQTLWMRYNYMSSTKKHNFKPSELELFLTIFDGFHASN